MLTKSQICQLPLGFLIDYFNTARIAQQRAWARHEMLRRSVISPIDAERIWPYLAEQGA